MIYISHRGNLTGKSLKDENNVWVEWTGGIE